MLWLLRGGLHQQITMLSYAVGGSIGMGDYLEAGTIVFLFTLADWLESRSTDKVCPLESRPHD